MSAALRPRVCVAGGSAYTPPPTHAHVTLDLAGNEGVGPSAAFIASTLDAWAAQARLYPSPAALGAKLAGRLGVSPAQVVLTPGADDALDRICRIVLEPGRSIVLPSPTFEMIERYARVAGAEVRELPYTESLTARAVLDCVDNTTGLVALVTPNNPTGVALPAAMLLEVARALPSTLVLVDLAYIEFADEDPTPLLVNEPNVVMTRTLSKAWGLAGLRVGYSVSSVEVAGWLRAAAGPYGVAGPSMAIASAWLDAGQDETARYVAQVHTSRAAIAAQLAAAGWHAPPSQANFVTVASPRAAELGQALLAEGVRIRTWPHDPVRRGYARITAPGSAHDLETLARALDVALAQVAP